MSLAGYCDDGLWFPRDDVESEQSSLVRDIADLLVTLFEMPAEHASSDHIRQYW